MSYEVDVGRSAPGVVNVTISQEQLQKLDKWMQKKNVRIACECCGSTRWSAEDIISAPTFSAGNINFGGPTVPMVQVVCTNCGNVRLFAAVPIGLIPEANQQAA
jgi:hypothetical protein